MSIYVQNPKREARLNVHFCYLCTINQRNRIQYEEITISAP